MTLAKLPALMVLTAIASLGVPAVAAAQQQPQGPPPGQQDQSQGQQGPDGQQYPDGNQGPQGQGPMMGQPGPGQQGPMMRQGPMPSYAAGEEEIHGRITQITGKYQIFVRDDRGFVDNVALHDGTIINPRGLTLQTGQSISVLGHADGKTFSANEIDTPYRYAGGYPGPYYNGYYGPRFYGYYGPRFYGRFYGRF